MTTLTAVVTITAILWCLAVAAVAVLALWQEYRDARDNGVYVSLDELLQRPAWDTDTGPLPIVDLEIGRHLPPLPPDLPRHSAAAITRPRPWMVGPRRTEQLALTFAGASKVRPARMAALLDEAVA